MKATVLSASPEASINKLGGGFCPRCVASKCINAGMLGEGGDNCTVSVTAAVAWAAGAIIHFAATGYALVQDDPDNTCSTYEACMCAVLAQLQEVHAA